jgi:hypothetical protein
MTFKVVTIVFVLGIGLILSGPQQVSSAEAESARPAQQNNIAAPTQCCPPLVTDNSGAPTLRIHRPLQPPDHLSDALPSRSYR